MKRQNIFATYTSLYPMFQLYADFGECNWLDTKPGTHLVNWWFP